jgi:hypothetical protein
MQKRVHFSKEMKKWAKSKLLMRMYAYETEKKGDKKGRNMRCAGCLRWEPSLKFTM